MDRNDVRVRDVLGKKNGLASVAGPVVIHRLQAAMPGVTISLADLIEIDTVGGLADLLDVRLKELNATGVGTGRRTGESEVANE